MKKSRVKRRSAARSIWRLCGAVAAIACSSATLAAALSLVYAMLAMPDSLVAKWLVRPLALAGAVTIGPSSGSGLPTSVGATTSTTTPAPAVIRPTKVGQNLDYAPYWGTNRVFMNLAADEGWVVKPNGGGSTDSYFDANRNVIKVLPGDNIHRFLVRPPAIFSGKSVDVVCRWDGVGTLAFHYDLKAVFNFRQTANSARYTQRHVPQGWVVVSLKAVDAANPIRNMDCREAGADPQAVFEPAYIAHVKRYHSVRFMGWQRINDNKPVTWATRTVPAMGQIYGAADGYAIEYMIELANQAKVDPWFCMPWNADDDYVRKFAQMVRDRLDPDLVAYVETSNEVWNWGFPVTEQAYNEGVAANLSSNPSHALYYRYAQKTIQQMNIWTDVFAGQKSRIVRVAASQNANPATIGRVLEFADTPTRIDAISSAPYFEISLNSFPDLTDLSALFAALKTKVDTRFASALGYKALADQHNLRYVTYEGGQHVTGGTIELQSRVQSDPRMGQLYTYYLQRWNDEIGDQITLLLDIGPIGNSGAWAQLDYLGQSHLATPKSRAVTLFMASIGR